MTRDCALKLIRVLAEKNNCKYIEPDEDVLRLMIQFAELVEKRYAALLAKMVK